MSYYSRISNNTVYHNAGKPKLPSESLVQLQHKMLSEVFLADMQEPTHNVVFCSGYKDRIRSVGRRRGRGRYWLEECCHRFYPEEFLDHTASNTNWRYVLIKRKLSEGTRQSAHSSVARTALATKRVLIVQRIGVRATALKPPYTAYFEYCPNSGTAGLGFI